MQQGAKQMLMIRQIPQISISLRLYHNAQVGHCVSYFSVPNTPSCNVVQQPNTSYVAISRCIPPIFYIFHATCNSLRPSHSCQTVHSIPDIQYTSLRRGAHFFGADSIVSRVAFICSLVFWMRSTWPREWDRNRATPTWVITTTQYQQVK